MKLPCPRCGREEPKTCSRQGCPFFAGTPRTFKKDFSGTTPNIFVGQYGYPDVRVGILATEQYAENDNPQLWTKQQTPIPTIMDKRASLINSQFLASIHTRNNAFVEQAQLIAQGATPTDMEVRLDKTPRFTIQYPPGTSPHGANARLIQSRLTQNVRVPRAVDKAVSDTDMKANTALQELYGKIDEYAMSKLLTGGVLGQGTQRKLVPTRWGITAVDDTLGKQLLARVRDFPVLAEPRAYVGGHYGNHYVILFFPRQWQYELFEYLATDAQSGRVWTDYEGFSGRTQYARDTAGGYYAARLPIAQKLVSLKRQAAVLCLRFVTEEYTNPLGVWVVREAVRQALSNKPVSFSTEELLLSFARAKTRSFGIDYDARTEQPSKLLKTFAQKTLQDFTK